jgi:hypothetical protein
MQVHQTIQNLNEVKSGIFFIHPFDGLEVVEQLTPGTVIQHKTDEIVSLKAVIEFNYEGMIEESHD